MLWPRPASTRPCVSLSRVGLYRIQIHPTGVCLGLYATIVKTQWADSWYWELPPYPFAVVKRRIIGRNFLQLMKLASGK